MKLWIVLILAVYLSWYFTEIQFAVNEIKPKLSFLTLVTNILLILFITMILLTISDTVNQNNNLIKKCPEYELIQEKTYKLK